MNNFESIHSSLDFNESLLEANPFADAVPTGSGSIEPAETQHNHDIEQQTVIEQQTTPPVNEQEIEEEPSEITEQLQQVDINKSTSLDTSSIEDTQVKFHFYINRKKKN